MYCCVVRVPGNRREKGKRGLFPIQISRSSLLQLRLHRIPTEALGGFKQYGMDELLRCNCDRRSIHSSIFDATHMVLVPNRGCPFCEICHSSSCTLTSTVLASRPCAAAVLEGCFCLCLVSFGRARSLPPLPSHVSFLDVKFFLTSNPPHPLPWVVDVDSWHGMGACCGVVCSVLGRGSFLSVQVTPISIRDLQRPFEGAETAYLLIYRSRRV